MQKVIRLNKLDQMTEAQKEAERERFEELPDDALVSQEMTAIVIERSLSFLQKKRCEGGGIPFYKEEGTRTILYQKSDILAYLKVKFKRMMHTA